ncbi:MAG: OPT family oligopeptide transporter [Gammaproteobacteria bacterium]
MSKTNELTPRALMTGMVLGAVLAPCNVYSGLKIGWSFNMSIITLLVGFAFWRLLEKAVGVSVWTLKESNIGQTTASSAASIISGGLVAPIPAYTLITGEQLPILPLMGWVFAVSFLGVWVAWYLRPALIVASSLHFPAGMATLETMKDIFGHGREAMLRISVLLGAGFASGLLKWVHVFFWALPKWSPLPVLKKLTFGIEPSLLLVGFGAIIGIRVGMSLLLGALLAWGWLAPMLLERGWVEYAPSHEASLFGPLVEWLLWPGVSLMVTATLSGLVVRLIKNPRLLAGRFRRERTGAHRAAVGFSLAALLTVALQMLLFDISLTMALLAIPLAVLLASVAARVVGETGIPPIGAIGKMSQLSFGVLAPGQAVTNLMTANIAGGAAGQSADLLNDFKVGHAIQASPFKQAVAQCFGIVTGSVVGTLVYLSLIPDPAGMLLTEQWPAPAVATWKAVAEALGTGLDSIPASARMAMFAGSAAGVVMGLSETLLKPSWAIYLPSSAAVGLAFVIPASVSLMMFFGALTAWLFAVRCSALSARFTMAAAAGLIAGESIIGVAASFWNMTGF